MQFSTSLVGAVCLSAIASVSLGGTRRADRTDAEHLAYANFFPSVGVLNDGRGVASGVLIAPQWVLTAGHCVGPVTQSGITIPEPFFVTFSPYANAVEHYLFGGFVADEWFPHENWTGHLADGFDIGLIHLQDPVPSSVAEPVQRYYGESEFSMLSATAGYGATNTADNGVTLLDLLLIDFQRRAGLNRIDLLGSQYPDLVAEFGGDVALASQFLLADMDDPGAGGLNRMGSSEAESGEYLVASGDSGGGVFIDHDDNPATPPLLAGINSFVDGPDGSDNSSYGDIAGFTRVSHFNDWINSNITLPGDADVDFDVDLADLGILASHYGLTDGGHWHFGDFDLDGDIDIADLGSLATHYSGGQASAYADFQTLMAQVPEPASSAVLAVAGVLLGRRWRRRA